ncbi:MAG: LPS sulfotransferase NodH [Psychroserpens sp.]
MFTTQRTGSTWLVDMLNNNCRVGSYSELFRLNVDKDFPSYGEIDIKLFNRWKVKYNPMLELFRKKKQINEYFDQLTLLNSDKKHVTTFGCKIMYNQVNKNKQLLRNSFVFFDKFIHLKRRDHLRVAISHVFMEQTGVSHSDSDVDLEPIEVNISNIVYYLKVIKKEEKRMDSLLKKYAAEKYIVCYYEDLVESTDEVMAKIHEHIGVKHTHPASNFKKINNSDLNDMIINYDDLILTLKKESLI